MAPYADPTWEIWPCSPGYLVVGRPIIAAPSPRQAAMGIVDELKAIKAL
jgi:orotidine-5'-phosphate decarboxylase